MGQTPAGRPVPCPWRAGAGFQRNALDAQGGPGGFARASLFLEGFLCQTSHQLMSQCHPKNGATVPPAPAACVSAHLGAHKSVSLHRPPLNGGEEPHCDAELFETRAFIPV